MTSVQRRRRRHALLFLEVTAAIAVLTGACTPNPGPSVSTPAPTTAVSDGLSRVTRS